MGESDRGGSFLVTEGTATFKDGGGGKRGVGGKEKNDCGERPLLLPLKKRPREKVQTITWFQRFYRRGGFSGQLRKDFRDQRNGPLRKISLTNLESCNLGGEKRAKPNKTNSYRTGGKSSQNRGRQILLSPRGGGSFAKKKHATD